MSPEKKADRFPCPGCSADMQFDPVTGAMKCPFCGKTQTLAPATTPGRPAGIASHLLDEFLAKQGDSHLSTLSSQALEVSCAACGSAVTFQPPEVAGSCPFCGDALVAQPKAADPLVAPDAVLPASITKDKAQTEIRAWLQTRWFAPNALKRLARQEAISGVYLPFWDYDADTTTQYSGQRGEQYYETESYTDADGNTQTRQVMRTAWYPASGVVSRRFENVLVPASRSVSESKLSALEPWGLDTLRPYEPAFLAGFKAQRYQLDLGPGFEKAGDAMRPEIEHNVRRDIGGDEQSIDSMNTDYFNAMFRHLLLPVWIGAYRFQNEVYQVAVNACTGEVQGERPYSAVKIAMLVLFIIALIALAALLKHQ
jgi:ribosomal protein S27E